MEEQSLFETWLPKIGLKTSSVIAPMTMQVGDAIAKRMVGESFLGKRKSRSGVLSYVAGSRSLLTRYEANAKQWEQEKIYGQHVDADATPAA